MAGQGGATVFWHSMRVSEADEYPDWQNASKDKSCERDAGAQEIGKLAAANLVQSSSKRQTGHVGEEYGW